MAWYLNETQVGHLLCVRVTAVDVRDRRAGIGDCRGYLDAGVFPDERDREHERGDSARTDSVAWLGRDRYLSRALTDGRVPHATNLSQRCLQEAANSGRGSVSTTVQRTDARDAADRVSAGNQCRVSWRTPVITTMMLIGFLPSTSSQTTVCHRFVVQHAIHHRVMVVEAATT